MGNQFKPAIKALIFLHTIMLMGQILLAVIGYFISTQFQPTADEKLSRILQSVAVVLALGGGAAAFVVFKKSINELQLTANGIVEKMAAYRAASIVKFALLEAPSIFCIVGFILTHNISFLLLSIVLILVFAGQKPTVSMMMYDMQVGREDLFE